MTETFTSTPVTITVTDPGAYSLVSVTSQNGCTGTVSGNVNLIEYNVNVNLTPVDPKCFGQANGSITASASGGTSPYTYVWSNSGSGAVQNNLGPGTYTVTATDNKGCTEEQTVTLTEPPQLTADLSVVNNIDCYTPQATVDLEVNGGTPGYTYLWSNNSSQPEPTFTSGGTYTVTVTDSKNCKATATATITQNTTQPTAVANFTGQINCNTTEITIDGTGSSTGPDFTYQWSGPGIVSGDNTLNPVVNLGGSYTMTVTNNLNGCTKTVTVNIPQNNTPPNAAANAPTNISCTNPTVSINGNGSTTGAGISYQWSTSDGNIVSGATTLNPQVNLAGTYTILVTNNNTGCTAEASVTVSGNNTPPTVTINPPGEVNCFTPTINLDADGNSASGNVNYNWSASGGGVISGGGNSSSPTISAGGTYTVTVTDPANSCTSTATVSVNSDLAIPTAVAAPPAILTCQTTELTLNGTGSSSGPDFSYQWSGPGIVSGETTLNPVIDAPGSYTLTVTNNDNGCTKSVTVNVGQNITPPNAVANAPTNISCTNPTVSINGTGSSTGASFTYQWSTVDGNIVSGSTTLNPQVNLAGTYTILVTNTTNGCTSEASVTVNGNITPPTVTINPPGEINCFTPTINLDADGNSASGNVNYNWSASGGGVISGGGNSSSPTISAGGNFTVTVTDPANSCTSTATVSVGSDLAVPTAVAAPPAVLTCQATELTLDASGSSSGPDFSYQWSGPGIVSGETTLNPVIDAPGAYTLTVTNNDNGCTKTVTVNVTQNANLPNAVANANVPISCTNPTVNISGVGSSTGANFTFQWSTQDGNFVSGQNTLTPQVDLAGTYTIVVTNTVTGCTNEASVTVTGNDTPPTVSINQPGIVDCYNPVISLEADGWSQSGNLNYQWTATNGGVIAGGGNSSTPDVSAAGTYTVVVTDPSNNCTATSLVTVAANQTPPVAVAAPPATLTCLNPEITINGNGSSQGPEFSYEWTGPGIVSGETTLNPVIDAPGAYTLVVTNSINGCTKSVTVNVSSNQNYPTVSAGPEKLLNCLHPTVQLQGQASQGANFAFTWTANPGNFVSGQNTLSPTVNEPGVYYLLVTNTANGCTSEDFVTVDANFDTPDATIATPQILNCYNPEIDLDATASTQGPNDVFQWTTSNGTIVSGANTPSPTVSAPGTYTLLITNSVSGCTDQAQVTVTQDINKPTANAGPGATLTCTSPFYTINATASVGPQFTYLWSGPSIVSGETTLNPVVDGPGTYWLTVTNLDNGCTKTASVAINSNQNYPNAFVQPPGSINCAVPVVELNGIGTTTGANISYQWTASPGNIVSGANTLKPKVNEAGYYTLVVTNTSNGCTDEVEVFVDEDTEHPFVNIAPPLQLNCNFPSVQIDASNSSQGNQYNYQWSTTNGNILYGNGTPTPEVNEPGTYNLVLTNQENFCTTTASVQVTEDFSLPTAVAVSTGTLTCQFPQVELSGQGSSDGWPFFPEWSTTNGNILSGNLTLNPIVNQPGTYTLTVTNTENGCSSTATATVVTSQTFPTANAGPAQILTCANAQLNLDGSGSSQGSQYVYVWSTQNGNIVSGANTLNPVINQPGNYDLNVLNTQTGCASTASVSVGQNFAAPTALAAPGGILSCTVNSLVLDGTGSSAGANFTYNWTSPNGNILSGGTTLNPTVNAVGTYNLVVTNQNNGCSATASTTVSADASLPVASAGAPDTLTCAVQQLVLDATASSQGANFNYAWTGPGLVLGGSSLTPTINAPGLYELLVTNTSNGCTAISSVNIPDDVVHPIAEAGPAAQINCNFPTLTLDGTPSSSGAIYTYQWTTSGGNFVSGQNTTSPVINQPGTYNILVTNTQNGCTSTDNVVIDQNITPPAADAGPNGLITCTNATVTLSGTGSTGAQYSYSWTTSNGNIASGDNTLTPVVDAAGTYSLLVTNTQTGCTSTDNVTVNKDANVPTALATVPGVLNCSVAQIQLNGNASSQGPNIQFNWTTTNGNFVSGQNTLTPTVNQPGQYILHILNTANNCTASSTVTVDQNLTPPQADAGTPAVISCFNPQLALNGNGSSQGQQYTYLWSTTNGFIVSGNTTLSPIINQSGFYTLTVTDQSNGCTASSTVQILLDQNSPEADAGADPLLTCTVSSLQLNGTNSSIGPNFVYQWTASNGGNIVSGPNSLSPTINEPGTYTLLVSNPQNGCTAEDVVVVTENLTPPAVSAGPSPTLNCQVIQTQLAGTANAQGPGQLAYFWTTSGGNILTGQNTLAPTINQPGTYNMLVTNLLTGCTATASVPVQQNVFYPVVDAGPTAVLTCQNTNNTLSASVNNAGNNYQITWTTQNGNFVSGQNSLSPIVNAAGIYTLTIVNQDNFCTSSDQVVITQDASLPTAVAGNGPTLTCATTTAPLDGTGSSVGAQFTYTWTTQDGLIISGTNTLAPTVGEPGTYQLLVYNTQNSCQAVSSVVVGQNITPPLAVTGPPVTLTCTDASLTLSGAGSSVGAQFDYQWTTQDGQILSGATTLSPVVGEPGNYVLQVIDQNNGCASTSTAVVIQDVNAPLAAASTPGELTCQTTTLSLSGAGSSIGQNFDYQWTASNGGQILNGATTLSPTVAEPGTYTLLVTNSDNGCTETAIVTVAENVTIPAVNAGPDAEVTCTDPQIALSAIAVGGVDGISYAWTASNGGAIVSGANTANPQINAGGTYSLVVTDLYNGCTNTDQLAVSVDQTPPDVLIASPDQLTCAVQTVEIDAGGSSTGNVYNYSWSGPGIVSGSTTLAPVVNQPGLYTLNIVNSDNGCESQLTTTVVQDIVAPLAEAGSGFELTCSVEQDELSASGSSAGPNFTYQWTTQNGNILDGANTSSPLVDAVGIYNLLVTNTQTGCTATDQTSVTENTNYPAAIELATDKPACGGQPGSITFTEVTGGVGPYLYSIDNGENFMSANEFGNLSPGTYNLVVQDVNGCEYDQVLTFPVPVEPQVTVDPEISIEFGASTTLTAAINIPLSQIDTIIWSPTETLTPTNNPLVVKAQPFHDTKYTVMIVNKDGCVDVAELIVRVSDPAIWAPNAISPNIDDGVNDEFLIWAQQNTVQIIRSLQIYDRWGNQVFQAKDIQPNDPKLGWDGTFRGKVMNPAVFVWWAEVVLIDGRSILMKGDVTIVQ
ncbi:MAG: gliding motility-associated C-terminal domain-containing protein [Saprospiraceae bacterium]